MGQLGQLLAEVRHKKKLSLTQVEQETHIQQKHIKALEEGDYASLPHPAYLKGQLRSYATYLGLDVQQVMSLYAEETGQQVAAVPRRPAVQPLQDTPWLTLDLLIGVALLLAIIAFGAWAYGHYVAPLAQATPRPTPTATSQPTATSTPTMIATTPTSQSTPTPTPIPSGLQVQLEVIERTWLRVVVDDVEAFQGSLEAGAVRVWTAQRRVVVDCGNAGGVMATVNGVSYGLLGERAKVIHVRWTWQEGGVILFETPPPP